MAGRCAAARWGCCGWAARKNVGGLELRTVGLVGRPAMDLWTTKARCPQPHSRHICKSSVIIDSGRERAMRRLSGSPLLLVAVALAVAGVSGLSRHASGGGLAPIAFDVHLEDCG